MNEQSFTRVGDYEVLGVLGAGGMGKVYKVRNIITDRVEAMKTLLPDLAHRRALAERFLREIKLVAGLSHPNIASLHTALTWNNQLVMVMEFVEGITLAARIKDRPLSPAEAIDYISQVLSALSYAHSLHIIHRDIKPANMMLTPQGIVKLMDFGIARAQSDPVLTATGSTLGSLQYMSPEQVKGEPADERSDIYSLGVSLYEMVTGQRPFQADNEYAVMAAHLQKDPAPPITLRADMPAGLNEVILKAMAKEPAERFQTAAAFSAALRAVAEGKVEAKAAAPLAGAPAADATGTLATPPTAAVLAAIKGSEVEKTPVLPAALEGIAPASRPSASSAMASAPAAASGASQAAPPSAPPAPASAGNLQAEAGNVQPSVAGSAQPVALSGQLPPGANTHRGLYVALGSVIVLVVLVIAGISIPRLSKTHASGDAATFAQPANTQPANTQPANTGAADGSGPKDSPAMPEADGGKARDQSQPATTPDTPQVPSQPVGGLKAAFAPGKDSSANEDKGRGPATARTSKRPVKVNEQAEERAAAGPGPSVGNVPAPAVNPGRLQELEHDMDLLSSRADAVDSSLEGLRQNQAAQGLGLRGDIAGSQQRMRTYVTKAQSALRNQDADQAKKYLDLAETEVAKLEKFLGR